MGSPIYGGPILVYVLGSKEIEMPSIEILIAFFITTTMFAYIPGPAMIYVSAQTLARGQKAGLMASLGIHLGGYFHVGLVACGLAAVLALVPQVYFVIKVAGACYLIFLGAMLIFRRDEKPEKPTGKDKEAGRAFLESMIVEVLNPKTAIFFLAFLPQFVDLGAAWPVWVQMIILATVANILFSSADLFCVVFAGLVAKKLQSTGFGVKIAKMAAGSFLVLLGGKLALDR